MITVYDDPITLKKSNAVIAAKYRLSPNEQRVMYAILMQLRSDEEPTDQKFYFVNADDIVLEDGARETSKFNTLRRVCTTLYKREISITGVPNGASNIDTIPLLETRWIQSKATYFEGEGRIGLRLTHDILPFISQLRRDFTRLPRNALMAMTSSHAQRIFEMLMQFRDTGLFKISVADLRYRLDLVTEYKEFYHFKKRVIEVAVKQINEHAGINVAVQYKKKGRAVNDLVFTFSKDTPAQKAKNKELREVKKTKKAGKLDLRGFPLETVKGYCEKFGRDSDDHAQLNLSARQLERLKELKK
nr:replication initiation protein [uncultured Halomonas sp.]